MGVKVWNGVVDELVRAVSNAALCARRFLSEWLRVLYESGAFGASQLPQLPALRTLCRVSHAVFNSASIQSISERKVGLQETCARWEAVYKTVSSTDTDTGSASDDGMGDSDDRPGDGRSSAADHDRDQDSGSSGGSTGPGPPSTRQGSSWRGSVGMFSTALHSIDLSGYGVALNDQADQLFKECKQMLNAATMKRQFAQFLLKEQRLFGAQTTTRVHELLDETSATRAALIRVATGGAAAGTDGSAGVPVPVPVPVTDVERMQAQHALLFLSVYDKSTLASCVLPSAASLFTAAEEGTVPGDGDALDAVDDGGAGDGFDDDNVDDDVDSDLGDGADAEKALAADTPELQRTLLLRVMMEHFKRDRKPYDVSPQSSYIAGPSLPRRSTCRHLCRYHRWHQWQPLSNS
jgi:hypothetical protein